MALEDIKLWLFVAIGLLVIMFKSAGGATLLSLLSNTPDQDCQPLKRDVLRQRLGTSYNHRYMALDDTDLPTANENQDHITHLSNRTKRSTEIDISQISDPTPWTCKTNKVTINLGPNYFPRRVRSVTCSSSTCWFNHFRCQPKHYTIKILKKKLGKCKRVHSESGNPRLEDFWEEHDYKITVDCVCGL